MPSAAPDFFGLLRTLVEHEVRFIVVGGVCAVLNGAPVSTFDLDIVHDRAPDNIARLVVALSTIDAIFRHQFGRRIAPTASHLEALGHQLLTTRLGALDVLGTIGEGEDYGQLLAHTRTFEFRGLTLRVLDLPKLIEVKAHANRDKDRAVLPILRQTLKERQQGS